MKKQSNPPPPKNCRPKCPNPPPKLIRVETKGKPKEFDSLIVSILEENKKLKDFIFKHGICIDCGEMFSHDIDSPFASCKCKTSEWYKLAHYMKLEERLITLSKEYE